MAFIELLAFMVGLGCVGILVFGSWSMRLGTVLFVGTAVGGAVWLDWWGRFRAGDRVKVVLGHYRGASGIVVEPLQRGRGARVQIDHPEHSETVEFVRGYELQKSKFSEPSAAANRN